MVALAPVTAADVNICRGWIAEHSKSFYLSSLLLPRRVRHGAWALYAFCRRADDAADEGPLSGRRRRVEALSRRLDDVYGGGGATIDDATDMALDRAYAAVAQRHGIPRVLPEALLHGMEMDLVDHRYRTWDDLYLYCFRVAAVVGLMMTRIMGWSRADAFLRAADLGIAMQMTNIARDVGEDARRGRVYLPDELLAECGMERAQVFDDTTTGRAGAPLREAVRRLLARAEQHYAAADRGVPLLPRGCRLAIASSRHIYAAIGADLAAHSHDPIARRAHTSLLRKLALVGRAVPALWSVAPAPAPGPADALVERMLAEVGLGAEAREPSPVPLPLAAGEAP